MQVPVRVDVQRATPTMSNAFTFRPLRSSALVFGKLVVMNMTTTRAIQKNADFVVPAIVFLGEDINF